MDNEQCQMRVQKKKKKNVENAMQKTQYPNTTYISMALLSFITAQSSSSHLRTPKAKIPKVEKTKN